MLSAQLPSVTHSPGPGWGNPELRNTGQGQLSPNPLGAQGQPTLPWKSQTCAVRGAAAQASPALQVTGAAWEPAPPPLTTAGRMRRLASQLGLAGGVLALKEASHRKSGKNY